MYQLNIDHLRNFSTKVENSLQQIENKFDLEGRCYQYHFSYFAQSYYKRCKIILKFKNHNTSLSFENMSYFINKSNLSQTTLKTKYIKKILS